MSHIKENGTGKSHTLNEAWIDAELLLLQQGYTTWEYKRCVPSILDKLLTRAGARAGSIDTM